MSAAGVDWAAVAAEVRRQDETHEAGYPATRDGLRLALAAAEDELIEARDAHRDEREMAGWWRTRDELLQLAAVVLRAVRSIDHATEVRL